MHILLLRVGLEEEWQPLAHLAAALGAVRRTAVAIVTESRDPDVPAGALLLPSGEAPCAVAPAPGVPLPLPLIPPAVPLALPRSLAVSARTALLEPRTVAALAAAPNSEVVDWLEGPGGRWKLMLLPLALPPRLLLLGAGPDALPVVDFASRLHWRVTLVDHRAAYAVPAHFPLADGVLLMRPEEITRDLKLGGFTAAVVMSHHLPSDLEYLRALSASSIPYVGLLGPRARREKLLSELDTEAERLRPRLRAPVGLNLGGRTPESIALAIVAEVHAFVHGMQQVRSEP